MLTEWFAGYAHPAAPAALEQLPVRTGWYDTRTQSMALRLWWERGEWYGDSSHRSVWCQWREWRGQSADAVR